MIKTSESVTVIGRSTTFRGELMSTDEISIEGTVIGIVQAEGARVTVGKEARVKADITAQEVVVFGSVEGNVRATERVDLRSTAVVTGDLYAKRIAMEEDAVLKGKVDPNKAGEPLVSGAPKAMPALTVSEAKPGASFAAIVMPTPVAAAEPAAPTLFNPSTIPVGRQEGRLPSMLAAAERSLSGSGSGAGEEKEPKDEAPAESHG